MVNEDIVTLLRNAIARGDTIENAMRILIQSGYPPNEVSDASRYVGQGIIPQLQESQPPKFTPPIQQQNALQHAAYAQKMQDYQHQMRMQQQMNQQQMNRIQNRPAPTQQMIQQQLMRQNQLQQVPPLNSSPILRQDSIYSQNTNQKTSHYLCSK